MSTSDNRLKMMPSTYYGIGKYGENSQKTSMASNGKLVLPPPPYTYKDNLTSKGIYGNAPTLVPSVSNSTNPYANPAYYISKQEQKVPETRVYPRVNSLYNQNNYTNTTDTRKPNIIASYNVSNINQPSSAYNPANVFFIFFHTKAIKQNSF